MCSAAPPLGKRLRSSRANGPANGSEKPHLSGRAGRVWSRVLHDEISVSADEEGAT